MANEGQHPPIDNGEMYHLVDNVDRGLDADAAVGSESSIKKRIYTRDELLRLRTVTKYHHSPRIMQFHLGPRRDLSQLEASAPEIVPNIVENIAAADREENQNDDQSVRFKQSVLNRTRQLQLKLEQLKLKSAPAPK